MSEHGSSEPRRVEPLPVTPLSVEALPIDPAPPPLPYTRPMESARARPGIITTLGVFAIVIASLSILSSGMTGMMALGMWAASAASQSIAAAGRFSATATSSVTIDPRDGGALIAGERGLDDASRRVVIETLHERWPLTDKQKHNFDRLLAKGGKDILPVAANGAASSDLIKRNITDAGSLQSADADASGAYFVLGDGKLELYDRHAVFFPTDGGSAIRVTEGVSDSDNPFAPTALSLPIIDQFLARAQIDSGNKLTPQQLAALRAALVDPRQDLIDTTNPSNPPAQQLPTVKVHADGSAMISSSGFILIDAAGNVASSSALTFRMGPTFNIRGSAVTLMVIDGVLSALLAIYLLVVGILILRQTPRGWMLQWIYAILKVPLVIVGAMGWYWMLLDTTAATSKAAGVTAQPLAAQMNLVFFLVIGLAYPLALMIALLTRPVRDYYRSAKAT